ncbi:ABC transporter ATP-binding protein [Candidatus Woesearchaeota archaeon]|nr:ABC transporter ATP-binding protein [Candidatus Woesearchaeota archaeon]MCF7901548.1 ABC transporter ATP-binding protein [Candidatus Woesearchaeota archaeon]
METNKSPVLKIEEVNKTFARKNVLRNISIDIKDGEIIGIIGSSGSGKTTLLNSIVGFIKPDKGKIKFRIKTKNNEYKYYVLDESTKKYINGNYGFASQMPSFYEKLTVRENLEYFGELYSLNKETLRANTETLIKLMGLENSENVLAKKLSGGMERRLNIACAMIHNPDILILDEPTADLDPVLRNNIWNLIHKINKKGTTIILSSHHLSELETLCDRISILKEGKVLETATPKELKEKFGKEEEIKIQTYPGNYDSLGNLLIKKFPLTLKGFINSGNELTLRCEKSQDIVNDIINEIEYTTEKLIEIKISQPNLDDIFIRLNEVKLR